ncbi:hypothetical protein BCR34DRAFT_669412 [Clohesyomyces aquaticus]|uniref:Uncharacterized protein n=1 Tax=Clohesyomyces aquaticus TaxID=1231657 RepID=A0A1Y1YC93_9PLEO|nr:hypothetical protein BCR34DRAFT_669412 [Clohesyomyces aquaticus]
MTHEWNPNKVPGHDLSLEDYELFTSAAEATSLVRHVVPYGKGGAMEFRGVENDRDACHTPLYYWCCFSTADLESLPFDEKFCYLLRAEIDDAYILLLASLLKNLRRISLRGVSISPNGLPWTSALQRYSRLREFTIIPEGYYEHGFCPLSFWVDFPTLPTLELFTGDGATSWYQQIRTRSPFTLTPHTLNIRCLVMERCALVHEDLKLVLGACRDLKTFHYSTRMWGTGQEWNATSAQIVDLLIPFQDSDAYHRGSHPDDMFDDQPINSLGPVYPSGETLDTDNHIVDSHAYPVITRQVLDGLVEDALFELPNLITLDVVSKHDRSKEDLKISEKEMEIHRDSGKTAEELEPHRTHEVGATCWHKITKHYSTQTWQSLHTPKMVSKEEEDNEHEEVLAILAETEDAPRCNDEICELLQHDFDKVATRVQMARMHISGETDLVVGARASVHVMYGYISSIVVQEHRLIVLTPGTEAPCNQR